MTEAYHLLVDPLQPGNKLVVELGSENVSHWIPQTPRGNEPTPSQWMKSGAQKVSKR